MRTLLGTRALKRGNDQGNKGAEQEKANWGGWGEVWLRTFMINPRSAEFSDVGDLSS